MIVTTLAAPNSSRADLPSNPSRRHRADFAREMTLTEFRPRDGKALDQGEFVDRLPGRLLLLAPGERAR